MAAQVQTLSAGKNPFEKLGGFLIRYGLVLVLGWILLTLAANIADHIGKGIAAALLIGYMADSMHFGRYAAGVRSRRFRATTFNPFLETHRW